MRCLPVTSCSQSGQESLQRNSHSKVGFLNLFQYRFLCIHVHLPHSYQVLNFPNSSIETKGIIFSPFCSCIYFPLVLVPVSITMQKVLQTLHTVERFLPTWSGRWHLFSQKSDLGWQMYCHISQKKLCWVVWNSANPGPSIREKDQLWCLKRLNTSSGNF